MAKFNRGDKVKFIGQYSSAQPGALAVVTGADKRYVYVEFDRNDKRCNDQSDGGYYYDQFEIVETADGAVKDEVKTTLPVDSKKRKNYPVYSGPLRYFPKALTEVAQVCKIGNDKHNPGQPLHHARGKSSDHADCIIRHMIDMSEDFGKGVGRDENGVPQVAYIAWRALALAQEWLENNDGAPMAPSAKV